MLRILALTIALVLMICAAVHPDACPTAPTPNIAEFFRAITGEWIGVCKHATNGQPTDDNYLHAVVKETSPGSFNARFDYYRMDDKDVLQHIGTSDITATIASPTGATTRVVGNGELSVDRKIKRQEHDLTETLVSTGPGTVNGRGSGTLKVFGMPLGLGKLGKVRDDQSSWKVSNGTLTVHQSMCVVFRALFISKSFKVEADYTAVRGTDVSSLALKQPAATTKSGE